MINLNRVFAMMLRDFITLRHNLDRLGDMFYWPAMDLFIWGLTGLYISSASPSAHASEIILTGLIFWLVIWRAQYEISINLLHEMWDRNLVNIFASPLTIKEWMVSAILFGFIKMFASLIFSAFLAALLYHFQVFTYGLLLIPIVLNLVLTGWAAGFLVAGLIIRHGQKIQTIAWTGVYLIAPFSALYYPVSVLPGWAQQVSLVIPSSYMFEGMREILFTGSMSQDKFLVSFALNIVYLVLSIWFFLFMFNKSRKLGFGRLI